MAGNRDLIVRRFARQAKAFAVSPLQTDPERLRRLLEFAAPGSEDAVLDVACGPGIVTRALAGRVRLAAGVDLTAEMIREARAAGDGAYARADVERLPFRDGAFDLVLCRNAYHHFADPLAVAREAARVVRREGHVVIEDMRAPDDAVRRAYHETIERLRDASHVRTLTRDEFMEMMRACGLEPEREQPVVLLIDFEEWVERAFPPPESRRKARAMIEACLEEDRAGLRVWREGGRIKFERQSLLLRAVRAS